MDDVPCLLFAGDAATAVEVVRDFNQNRAPAATIVLFLATSAAALNALISEAPKGRAVILGPGTLASILSDPLPLESLKAHLRSQIDRRRLIPFDTSLSPQSNMFFGRANVLRRLVEEDGVNFAVAGPSRIGKTSLLRHYRSQLVRQRDLRMHSTHYIDCSRCPDKTPDGVASFIALASFRTRGAARVTSATLNHVVRAQVSVAGRPIDWLLDEIDEIVELAALRQFGSLAKEGLCRLVIAGKGVLLRSMLSRESPLEGRLDLIRLSPLSQEETHKLFFGPLADLGFTVAEPDEVLDLICRLTGKLPHLIQFYGSRAATLLLDQGVETLTCNHVLEIRDSFEVAGYFVRPLLNSTTPVSRAVIRIFLDHPELPLDVEGVCRLAQERNVAIQPADAWGACNELVLDNVLVWNKGLFLLANESLLHYSRTVGLLDDILQPNPRLPQS